MLCPTLNLREKIDFFKIFDLVFLNVFLSGYSLNRVFDDLLQFDFTTSLWSEVQAGSPKPVSGSWILTINRNTCHYLICYTTCIYFLLMLVVRVCCYLACTGLILTLPKFHLASFYFSCQ